MVVLLNDYAKTNYAGKTHRVNTISRNQDFSHNLGINHKL